MKTCSICNQTKSLDDFNKNVATPSGRRAQCKDCRRKYDKARYAADTRRERQLRSMYNITPDQFELMAVDGCMICASTEKLVVDHDHTCCPGWRSCGRCVRGILCGACNKAEGLLGSDPIRAESLAKYLRDWVDKAATV